MAESLYLLHHLPCEAHAPTSGSRCFPPPGCGESLRPLVRFSPPPAKLLMGAWEDLLQQLFEQEGILRRSDEITFLVRSRGKAAVFNGGGGGAFCFFNCTTAETEAKVEAHPSTMASPADEHNVAAAAEACEATGESHNPMLHQDRRRRPPETQAAADPEHRPLAKQSSLLSLTLDEIQTTVCEPGKSFGSMNLDELLTNIWTIEKGSPDGGGVMPASVQPGVPDAAADGAGSLPQASLCREGSLTMIKPPLRRKTVDEVWSEIHREEQQALQGDMQIQQHQDLAEGVPRHPALGEMTLEDFLVKAGVVRESGCPPLSPPPPLNQFPLQSPPLQQQDRYDFSEGYTRAGCGGTPMPTVGYGDHHNQPTTPANGVYHGHRRQQKRLLVNDHVGVGSPVSPVSSDGFGAVQVGSGNVGGERWGGSRRGGGSGAEPVGMSGGSGGRKRILDGRPLEKVVERRQRRMMKNRESAARSRARKQAYTVELEKELDFLKEENARLQEEQLLESMAEQSEVSLHRNARILRQCCSCVW
ncbi:hypothetical protein Taro_051020 [Colocasia esculenta]|uniref:BZIP domain-containing protein n=1 Tax=Colocasia esculenta TaxID=4460 RepID=A0A843XEW4_COLES|nr:hypothetical protein [Colocasia esculenta]